MPSGSARTAQPVPSGLRRSSRSVAPRARMRSTSSSRVRSCGWMSRCTRFLTVLASGTAMKSRPAPSISAYSSPGLSSSCRGRSRTWDQKPARV
ncbi:hypothetical protein StrepF001_32310 [Streptomyces sp. F001]|nr:hypothetical protein StrepF001_32310 [Streptomyces sp. F001]